MVAKGKNGCCTCPSGFKCSITWALIWSFIGLAWSIGAGSFWSWFTAVVAVVAICLLASLQRRAKTFAIVGALFSFLTFLLMAISSIVSGSSGDCLYMDDDGDHNGDHHLFNRDDDDDDDFRLLLGDDDDDFNGCHVLAIVAGIGSLVWLFPTIICCNLACQLGPDKDNEDDSGKMVPVEDVDVEKPSPPAEQAVNTDTTETEKVFVSETINPDGSKRIEETTTDSHGNTTTKVRIEPAPAQAMAIEAPPVMLNASAVTIEPTYVKGEPEIYVAPN